MAGKFVVAASQIMVMAVILFVVLLLVCVGVLVVIHICVIVRAIRRASSTVVRGERRGDRAKGLSPLELEQLPSYVFEACEKAGGSDYAADCAVCLENFAAGDRIRPLPSCRHRFHAGCVDPWLVTSPACPVCRAAAADTKAGVVPEGGLIGRSGADLEFRLQEGRSEATPEPCPLHVASSAE